MANAQELRSNLTDYAGSPRDFDFLAGDWNIKNRQLKQRNIGSSDWDEFDARQTAWLLLDGVANVDEFDCPARGFKGMSVRALDLETNQWSIYWINSRFGKLLNPVVGGFRGTHGVFYGDDEDEGAPIVCRFEWLADPARPTWKQSFSWDGGATWETNWIMEFSKITSSERKG